MTIPLGILASSGASKISSEFIGSFEDDGGTFPLIAGVDIGSPGLVVVAFHSEGPENEYVQINGVQAERAVAGYDLGQDANISIYYREVLGTSTIDVLAPSGASRRAVASIWRIDNYTNPVHQFSYLDNSVPPTSTQSVTTATLTEPSIVIAAMSNATGVSDTGTVTWTGINEDYDTNTSEGGSIFSGASTFSDPGAALTISVSLDPGPIVGDGSMGVAIWR